MKRVLTFLAIMLLPLSVWAMTPVTDSDLSNVTGQAGVNINADLTMDINIGTMAWGDADGVQGVYDPWTTVGAGGYVGMTNFNIHNLVITARTDTDDNYNTYNTLMLKPITIDVATGTKAENGTDATTFVRFGLGALKISMGQLQFTVSLFERSGSGTTDALDAATEQKMGLVTIGPMTMYINPMSYVDIYAHGAMGVSFDVNVTLDRLTMGYLSWGDTDGLGSGNASIAGATGENWMDAGTTAGYVGLSSFNLGDANNPAVTINGVVSIDVATSAHGIYASLPGLTTAIHGVLHAAGIDYTDYANGAKALYWGSRWAGIIGSGSSAAEAQAALVAMGMDAGYGTVAAGVGSDLLVEHLSQAYDSPVTVVHISFPGALGTEYNLADSSTCGFRVNVAKITANVSLSDNADLTSGASSVLGDIYIKGMEMKIKQGSWVDIWAH